jgi:hypothetical protein
VLVFLGFENISSYAFHTKKKSHKFCTTCGSSLYIDFQLPDQGETNPEKDRLAMNVKSMFLSPTPTSPPLSPHPLVENYILVSSFLFSTFASMLRSTCLVMRD